MVFSSAPVFSQRIVESSKTYEKIHSTANNNRSQKDTLWGQYDSWPSAKLYVSSVGFVLGTNNYNDKQKAQAYINLSNTSMIIEEAIVWFGYKQFNSADPNSKVVVKTYSLNGTGTNAFGPTEWISIAMLAICLQIARLLFIQWTGKRCIRVF